MKNEKRMKKREKFMFCRCIKRYDECRYTLSDAKKKERKKRNSDREKGQRVGKRENDKK